MSKRKRAFFFLLKNNTQGFCWVGKQKCALRFNITGKVAGKIIFFQYVQQLGQLVSIIFSYINTVPAAYHNSQMGFTNLLAIPPCLLVNPASTAGSAHTITAFFYELKP